METGKYKTINGVVVDFVNDANNLEMKNAIEKLNSKKWTLIALFKGDFSGTFLLAKYLSQAIQKDFKVFKNKDANIVIAKSKLNKQEIYKLSKILNN